METVTPIVKRDRRSGFLDYFLKTLKKDRKLLLFILPGILYYVLFHYVPMYGILAAFKKYTVAEGIWGSPWVGLRYFQMFFNGFDAWKIIRNTVLISFYNLVFGFPAPILFALLLNELRDNVFKRFVQTVSYLPHFISTVIICGMVVTFLQKDTGIINILLNKVFGIEPIAFIFEQNWFRTIFVSMHIWKNFGWGAIIYIAALSSIDHELYEAATIDGANRFQKILFVTLPGILPVIIILFILRLGQILNVGYETVILLYTPVTYETADVIDSYVYRRGLLEINYSFGAAVGLFKSAVAMVFVITANTLSRRYSDTSLW